MDRTLAHNAQMRANQDKAMKNDSMLCRYEDCLCRVSGANAVHYDGGSYCSQRCADGRGCDHAGCNCGKFATEAVEPHLPYER